MITTINGAFGNLNLIANEDGVFEVRMTTNSVLRLQAGEDVAKNALVQVVKLVVKLQVIFMLQVIYQQMEM